MTSRPEPPSTPTPALTRAWRAVRNVVSSLFGPDQASDDRTTRQGQVHPRNELRGRTFDGNPGGGSF